MTEVERFDALILGSGNGGLFLAQHLARSGQRTAVVERRWIGGSCPNINCLPSKNIIWSAKVADFVHRAASYGTTAGPASTDMEKVRQRKRDMVEHLISATLHDFEVSGVELIMGTGQFIAPRTLDVALNSGGTRILEGDQVFINVGTHSAIPGIPGLDKAAPLTNIEALELDYVPPHLIVLGGGYVGLELAQAFHRFGSRVTIIERGSQIARQEDPDIAGELQGILEGEGINIVLDAGISLVEGCSGDAVKLFVDTPSGERTIEGSDVLLAAGRIPNTAGIGLDIAGAGLDSRGYIEVNERLETKAPQVWAIGECAGSPQFTHVSYDDFRIIRDNLAGGNRTTHGRLVPFSMFTDPPLGRVGLNEGDAERRGIEVRVARLPMSAVLRSLTISETRGFMKALIAARDDQILGFTMLGAGAEDVISVVQMAMLAGLPFTRLRDAILTHPTMAEGLGSLLSKVPPPFK